jgi:hypothetical protein
LFAYVLLGLLAGFSGGLILEVLDQQYFGFYLWLLAGLFITLLGFLIILGKEPRLHLCQVLEKHTIGDGTKSMALLGFIVGITPCAPLIGILTYITFNAEGSLIGAFYCLCFGAGTAIITPLIVLGMLASVIPKMLFKTPQIYGFFKPKFLPILGTPHSCGPVMILTT